MTDLYLTLYYGFPLFIVVVSCITLTLVYLRLAKSNADCWQFCRDSIGSMTKQFQDQLTDERSHTLQTISDAIASYDGSTSYVNQHAYNDLQQQISKQEKAINERDAMLTNAVTRVAKLEGNASFDARIGQNFQDEIVKLRSLAFTQSQTIAKIEQSLFGLKRSKSKAKLQKAKARRR